MKPPLFAYVAPTSVPEALELLARHGDEAKILAGGQSLVPLLNMRLAQPQVLIDLNRVTDLQYITPRHVDGISGISIGAMTRQRAVEDSLLIRSQMPMLRDGISFVGHSQIRNRGTIGGSVAHADPTAELPLVFRAVGGKATVISARGKRTIDADDFFVYTFSPDIEPDEMLTEVWFPLPDKHVGQAFLEVARRHGDFALVAAAVSLRLDQEGVCAEVSIALGGAAPIPTRAREAEDSVRGRTATLALFQEAGEIAAQHVDPTSDVHADADYRRDVAGTLTYRSLSLAYERASRCQENSSA